VTRNKDIVKQWYLLQPRRTVVANLVSGKIGLFRRNPWQPLEGPSGSVEPRLKNFGLHSSQYLESIRW